MPRSLITLTRSIWRGEWKEKNQVNPPEKSKALKNKKKQQGKFWSLRVIVLHNSVQPIILKMRSKQAKQLEICFY